MDVGAILLAVAQGDVNVLQIDTVGRMVPVPTRVKSAGNVLTVIKPQPPSETEWEEAQGTCVTPIPDGVGLEKLAVRII